jgi:hypothetical protein
LILFIPNLKRKFKPTNMLDYKGRVYAQ